jgi:hypothetical protein
MKSTISWDTRLCGMIEFYIFVATCIIHIQSNTLKTDNGSFVWNDSINTRKVLGVIIHKMQVYLSLLMFNIGKIYQYVGWSFLNRLFRHSINSMTLRWWHYHVHWCSPKSLTLTSHCDFLTQLPENHQFKEGFETTGMLCYWSYGGWRVARPQELRANSLSLSFSRIR